MTVLLQPRSATPDAGIQLSLFDDEPDSTPAGPVGPGVDGLAPVRGIVVSLSLALVVWAALVAAIWATWR